MEESFGTAGMDSNLEDYGPTNAITKKINWLLISKNIPLLAYSVQFSSICPKLHS